MILGQQIIEIGLGHAAVIILAVSAVAAVAVAAEAVGITTILGSSRQSRAYEYAAKIEMLRAKKESGK